MAWTVEPLLASSQSGGCHTTRLFYKYKVGIPVLKGAGDNVLPKRGMVDLECKIVLGGWKFLF